VWANHLARSLAYKRYVLLMLTLVYTITSLDQVLMALVLQPIKQDLRLSDTQLGFLTGIAFGLFYATLGLPIARWADRGNRTAIAALAIALWGATVMACLFVTNFTQLVLARVAAAVGGAGGMPPTYSLVGDYFPEPAERTRALTIYMLASPLSNLLSFIAGGWLTERYGWRWTFCLMGMAGLLLALPVGVTIREPRRNSALMSHEPSPRFGEVLITLWRQKAVRHLSIALILLFTMGLGMGPWYAAFMMRSHGMTTSELGLWLGLIFGLVGMGGILLGGYVAARWFTRDERGQLGLSALAITATVPCVALFLFVPGKYQALAGMVPVALTFNFFLGPVIALMQRLVFDDMRATAIALVMMLATLIGMGVGPQIVGILSDLLAPAFGNDSLRYAMLLMSSVAFWGAYHLWRAGRTVARDLLAISNAAPPVVRLAAPGVAS
jgi:MFS family permease